MTRADVVAEARTWAIYALRCPNTGMVRYVGFTRDVSRRYRQHISAAERGRPDYPVYRWIRKLGASGLRPKLDVLEFGEGEWGSVERMWIERLKGDGEPLLNVALGGHFDLPEDARRRAGEKLKGRRHSAEALAKIDAAKRGRARPDVAERNRRQKGVPVGPQRLSEAERQRRSEVGKRLGAINSRAMWDSMTDGQRAERSAKAAEQMRRVWSERKKASA